MSTGKSVVIKGKGYNPSLGPRSTNPESIPIINNSIPSSSQVSPIPSPGTVKKQTNITNYIYEKNLYRSKHEISISSLSFLFMIIISTNLKNSKSLLEIERKLNNLGYSIGTKFLELSNLRINFTNNITSSGKSNLSKRYIKILDILQFLISEIWQHLFDKKADSLEKSSQFENQFMIIDNNPLLSKFISVPKEFESLNCESFVAGIIEGILDVSYFNCEVSAHTAPENEFPNRTVYLINFNNAVIERDNKLV